MVLHLPRYIRGGKKIYTHISTRALRTFVPVYPYVLCTIFIGVTKKMEKKWKKIVYSGEGFVCGAGRGKEYEKSIIINSPEYFLFCSSVGAARRYGGTPVGTETGENNKNDVLVEIVIF